LNYDLDELERGNVVVRGVERQRTSADVNLSQSPSSDSGLSDVVQPHTTRADQSLAMEPTPTNVVSITPQPVGTVPFGNVTQFFQFINTPGEIDYQKLFEGIINAGRNPSN
jgi:hypothetical protein